MLRKLATLSTAVLILCAGLSIPFSVETNTCGQCSTSADCIKRCGRTGGYCELNANNCGTCICI